MVKWPLQRAHCQGSFALKFVCGLVMQGVIGAGAAGLVAARELAREGHQPVVFEQGGRPGGVWVYTDAVEEASMPGQAPPSRCLIVR